MLNHRISTLGQPPYSAWATLFDWGLRVGGLFLLVFIVALARHVNHRSMLVVALVGTVMACGVVLVGICPVTRHQCHKVAALIVFFSGTATMLSLTAVLLWLNQTKLSKWLAVPSALAGLSFISFFVILAFLYDEPQRVFIEGPSEIRPFLWVPSLLEWLVFLTVLLWIVILIAYLYLQEQSQTRVRVRHQPIQA